MPSRLMDSAREVKSCVPKFRTYWPFFLMLLFCLWFERSSTAGPLGLPGHYSFECPPQFEIQDDTYQSKAGHILPNTTIVLQQKGLNDMQPKAFSTYARIMIETVSGKPGDFDTLSEPVAESLVSAFDNASQEQMEELTRSSNGVIKLVQWNGSSRDMAGDAHAVCSQYLRQAKDNPPVHVAVYLVQNYDCFYRITLSHRDRHKEWIPANRAFLSSLAFVPHHPKSAISEYLNWTDAQFDKALQSLVGAMMISSVFVLIYGKKRKFAVALILSSCVWALLFVLTGSRSGVVICFLPGFTTSCIAYPVIALLWREKTGGNSGEEGGSG